MARTWFAGPLGTCSIPPNKDAVAKPDGIAPSNEHVLSNNKNAVTESATAHQIAPIKPTQSDSESDNPATRATTSSSPEKQLNTQPTQETVDASANLAKLIEQHSKPKEPQAAASPKPQGARVFWPVGMMDVLAPSPSTPRRAPTAQMVPLPSNTAVTTTPAATTTPATSTSVSGPCPSTMTVSDLSAFLPATAPTSISLSSNISSSATASQKDCPSTNSTPKTPQITLTPAPATAPGAFKDATLAAPVQNTKLLSIAKQQTNGVKKRQYTKTRSPLKQVSTPESVTGEKRGRGRPRTQNEELPLELNAQHRPSLQPCTSLLRTGTPNQSSAILSAPSTSRAREQRPVTPETNSDPKPSVCSEDPRLWPGRGDYVASLLRFRVRPEISHSEPIHACANHAAHRDSQNPRSYGVCITCRHGAFRHIRTTRPELLISAWWPLCKTCGDKEMLRIEPRRKGCSCHNKWLCFSCQTDDVERRNAKNSAEAEYRRRTFIGQGMDGTVRTVTTGWACDCGKEIGPDATLMRCIGCQGMRVGKVDPQEVAAREKVLRKIALAWM